MMKTCNDSLTQLVEGILGTILVEKPCKVVTVNSQYSVDVEYYDNNTSDMLYNVPVKHMQTSNAYVFLGLNAGDRGTVRFFDTDTGDYLRGSGLAGSEVRKHNINDSVFSCGFYPSREQYVMTSGDIVIGTSDGAVVNLTGECITITGADVVISGSTVTLDGSTTIDGKVFLEHTHSNGNNGASTGAVE